MIKFIRKYNLYSLELYDIIYVKNGYITKVCTRAKNELPKTAIQYLANATNVTNQYDTVFHREEIIYTL